MQTALPPKSPFYGPDPSVPVPKSPFYRPDPSVPLPESPEADPALPPEVDDAPEEPDHRADVIEPGLASPTDDDAPVI